MLDRVANIFKIPELRERITFTLLILLVYRIGGHVPLAGIDAGALGEFFSQNANTLFGLYDMFVGGAFQRATVFALGIMPYISASIIFQLMGTVVPYFQKLQKEGEEGRKKITQLTRYGTVIIAALQAGGVSIFLERLVASSGAPVVPNPGIFFNFLTMISLSAGTTLIMWLGEQITERGIGNGISLLIFVGIIDRLPYAIMEEAQMVSTGTRHIMMEAFFIVMLFAVTAAVVALTQGMRKIPVQYAKRTVGRKMYGGVSTHIPLRVNSAGVMPIIFAQSIMFVPSSIATFLPEGGFRETLTEMFAYNSAAYSILTFILIVFFTYFYTAIILNPVDLADNMKKNGGFVPGIRPGKQTSDFIDSILSRVTLPGAIALGLIAVLPTIIVNQFNVSYNTASFFGGTSLLIVVGVGLDTLQQVESHLVMRHYDGLMKSGRIRGRRRM
ncbi:preprotein translocase subunit SecY [bacterium]|nr:preprotein translocase subunit SecY [bacterium]MBU1637877.1 preprotein translocase subunit SecY [bacterium]MBU1920827.1 preprotein translocase subunit SecY [bacterium]RQV94206.1 MAG: preprotein translocase subunit SecY [bacterium]